MGLLSSSKSSSSSSTEVVTTTNTEIGDIGLTGSTAVALAQVLGDSLVRGAQINASALDAVRQQTGTQFTQLVGGAGEVVTSATRQAEAATASLTNWKTMLMIGALFVGGLVFVGRMRG